MDRVTLVTEGWTSQPVFAARSFLEKWRGVKALPGGSWLLMPAKSVHGFGLKETLLVAAIDGDMRVSDVRVLDPGRVLFFPRARLVLELPIDETAPPVGSVLELHRG